ncbi:MAG: prephenate/arogenate dehydrogenase [Acaryochloridaceae cyanobacterium SU_2_1]|nr:prephenate/arogenate dehydrogenase [Acaryochloridaceae cyanobacterium SU_2_1]
MKIGIVGLGLIGGSLGFDLQRLGHQVLGVSRLRQTCEQAVALGAVSQASPDLASLAEAELVFICTPLGAIAAIVTQLIPHLSTQTILTDVGSVKGSVVKALDPLWPRFLGGHPMAGSEETGIYAAQPYLFAGNPYVLTPTASTPVEVTQTVSELVSSLDCCLYQCSATMHDRAVAWISHLPKMVSASLITACLSESDPEIVKLAQALASSGFRDTSRVGGGNSELGCMMAEYNQTELLRSLHAYRHSLDQLITLIEASDWSGLEKLLIQAHALRLISCRDPLNPPKLQAQPPNQRTRLSQTALKPLS